MTIIQRDTSRESPSPIIVLIITSLSFLTFDLWVWDLFRVLVNLVWERKHWYVRRSPKLLKCVRGESYVEVALLIRTQRQQVFNLFFVDGVGHHVFVEGEDSRPVLNAQTQTVVKYVLRQHFLPQFHENFSL